MNPLIKWPGGKASEISKIENLIPNYDRYIEPFLGGGAVYFHLMPKKAIINDISSLLIDFYKLLKRQDAELYSLLLTYNNTFRNLSNIFINNYPTIFKLYDNFYNSVITKSELNGQLLSFCDLIYNNIGKDKNTIILNQDEFCYFLLKMSLDKIQRTVHNSKKSPFSIEDLKENLLTGFTSGYYMYFRKIYNDINLSKIPSPSLEYQVANFYFIREYCYGSMFRYNSKGEFNIPYGGMSYNNKNFEAKIKKMFNNSVQDIFSNTSISCSDFETFINSSNLTENDFMFLDPPYDTDFSDYEGKDFTKFDQQRLANVLYNTHAKFILIIKNTEFICNLYKDHFKILTFDNKYSYNVRGRNEQNVEHLIITNIHSK